MRPSALSPASAAAGKPGEPPIASIQEEYTRDLPSLPLFNRVLAYASNTALQNFNPSPNEMLYTWNIARWVIPGKDTIVIAQRSEPTSLSVLTDDSYITRLIGALVFGVDTTSLGYDTQPITLKQIPSIENGIIQINVVRVGEGEHIVDANGNAVELQAGVASLMLREMRSHIVAVSWI